MNCGHCFGYACDCKKETSVKTSKEIKGRVCGWRDGLIFVELDNHDDLGIAAVGDKVTIHHEVPERKVEISESTFNEMMRDVEMDRALTVMSGNHVSARTRWYQKLFSKSEG
jgi:hypothetical protein